jgi:hypothetical protein
MKISIDICFLRGRHGKGNVAIFKLEHRRILCFEYCQCSKHNPLFPNWYRGGVA